MLPRDAKKISEGERLKDKRHQVDYDKEVPALPKMTQHALKYADYINKTIYSPMSRAY